MHCKMVWCALLTMLAQVLNPSSAKDDSPAVAGPASQRLGRIAVPIKPYEWLVRRLLPEGIDLVCVVRPGEEPETFQPTDREAALIAGAEIVFRLGLPWEDVWLETISRNRAAHPTEVVDLRKGITMRCSSCAHDHGHESDSPTHSKDPHIWTTPLLMKKQARTIAEAICRRWPEVHEPVMTRLESVESTFKAVHDQFAQRLRVFENKAFLTDHPTWGYFADEFGLRMLSIEVDGKAPSDAELTRLQRECRSAKIDFVLTQPQFLGSRAKNVGEVLGAVLVQIDPQGPEPLRWMEDLVVLLEKEFSPR